MRTRRWAAGAVALLGACSATIAACGPRRSPESFCEQLKALQDLDEVLAGGEGAPVVERAGELDELRQVAPESIEPQVSRLAAVTDELARTMRTTPDADAAASEVFGRRRAELPEITAAGRAVEAYATEHCQLELNPTATAPPPTTPPPAPTTTSTTQPPSTRRATTTKAVTRSSAPKKATTTSRKPVTSRRSATTTTRRAATTTTRRR